MISACTAAQVKTVLCSRKFVERGKLDKVVERLAESVKLVWMEDIRESVGRFDKLLGLVRSKFARNMPGAHTDPDMPAIVLPDQSMFTARVHHDVEWLAQILEFAEHLGAVQEQHVIVGHTVHDQQWALEVFGIGKHGTRFVACGVALWAV